FAAADPTARPPSRPRLTHPRTPEGPATRPHANHRPGRPPCKLLHEPRRRAGELRALAGPVLYALHVDSQRLAPLGRLGVVESHALQELSGRRTPRIGHHQVIERPLVGAASLQSNHHHWEMLRGPRKGADYTGEIRPLGRICATVIITMHHPHATDEVIDLIASIEIQRQEMESRSGLEPSRNFALSRLQEALAGEQLPENVEALNQAIRRVQALGKRSNA